MKTTVKLMEHVGIHTWVQHTSTGAPTEHHPRRSSLLIMFHLDRRALHAARIHPHNTRVCLQHYLLSPHVCACVCVLATPQPLSSRFGTLFSMDVI